MFIYEFIREFWLTCVLSIAAVYVIILTFMTIYQRHFLYHSDETIPLLSDYGLSDKFTQISIPSHDGLLLHSWFLPPRSKEVPMIVFFHGNAGHIGHRSNWFRFFKSQGFGVLAASYRYNAGNEGEPSEEFLLKDGQAILNWLETQQISSEQIILYGESLGSGLATSLSVTNMVKATILEGAFSSITDVAAEKFSFLPVRFLLKDHFANINHIGEIQTPVLILHGAKDSTVPLKFARKLFQKGNPEKRTKT